MSSAEQVVHALRGTRAASYRVETTDKGATLELVMKAGESGRRNAASRIVRVLGEHGMLIDTDNPVEALTRGGAYGVGTMNDSTVA